MNVMYPAHIYSHLINPVRQTAPDLVHFVRTELAFKRLNSDIWQGDIASSFWYATQFCLLCQWKLHSLKKMVAYFRKSYRKVC